MSETKKIVILNQDSSYIQSIMNELKGLKEEFSLEIQPFTSAANFLLYIEKNHPLISVILIDFHIPGANTLELIDQIERKERHYQIILLANDLNRNLTESFLHTNLFDLLDKKTNFSRLQDSIKQAHLFYLSKMEKANRIEAYLMNVRKTEILAASTSKNFHGIIGESEESKELQEKIETISKSTAPCFILGESGTGKELIARAIHEESNRKEKPFVVVNCGSLSTEQIESEIFGIRKGVFAGVNYDKLGLLEIANEGTVYLDEVTLLPLDIQSKLVRFLEEGMIQPLGDSVPKKLDVRVIASTNTAIEELVKVDKFKKELYFRLNVLPIIIAPLRERIADLPALLNYFITFYNQTENKTIQGFNPEIIPVLEKYYWPGNIRELKNAIQRMVLFSKEPILGLSDIPIEISNYKDLQKKDDPSTTMERPIISIKELEKRSIEKALKKANQNKELAAKALGISRASIYRKMKEYGIE